MRGEPGAGQHVENQGGAPMLTNRATAALAEAANAARRFGHVALGTEHLLLGLLAEGSVRPLLQALGVDVAALETDVKAAILRGKALLVASPATSGHARRVLQLAEAEALACGSSVEPEHLLVALIAAPEGIAPELLRRAGADLEAARRALPVPG